MGRDVAVINQSDSFYKDSRACRPLAQVGIALGNSRPARRREISAIVTVGESSSEFMRANRPFWILTFNGFPADPMTTERESAEIQR